MRTLPSGSPLKQPSSSWHSPPPLPFVAQPLCLVREALSPHDLVCPHFTEEETEPWEAARWSWFPGLLTLGLWPASLPSEVSPPDGSTAPQPGRCV